MNGQRFPRVNIVSDDYARYGTSIYQKLYNRNGDGASSVDGSVCGSGNSAVKKQSRDSGSYKNKVVTSPIASHEDERLVKTTTIGSSFSICNGSVLEDAKSMTQQSLDTASGSMLINDCDSSSKRSKMKRRYKSLISSSSKKLINRLHEHGSSDTFSIFSLRTSHSNKQHELLKSENTIYEKRPEIKYDDINCLPVEVLASILLMVSDDQKSLTSALYVSRAFCEAAKTVLYQYPKFTSTYRVGQFVTSLRLHPENGNYVKVLDLSHLRNGLIGDQTDSCDSRDEVDEEERRKRSVIGGSDSLDDSSDNDNYEIALAGWRDWRHRNDPFYGATFLNSFNLKKVVSRSSSISSQVSSSTTSSQALNSMTHARKHRSNSSVSSFTSSIMSSFQNPSHVSLTTTNSTNNGSVNYNVSAGTKNSNKDQKQKNRESIWLKIKIGSKKRNRIKNQRIKEKKIQEENQRSNNDATVKFEVSQPYKRKHPYTNKFLLKYAPYCDLPIGYLLHILKLCPNITKLNLSNLIVCSDFELICKKSKIRPSYSMLSAVQESVVATTKSEADLEVVYLTDSNKSYDYYTNSRNRMSTVDPLNFFKTSTNSSDYPLPIEGQSKRRNLNGHHYHKANNVRLRKLNPVEIFELICGQTRLPVGTIKMDGIVWCRQNMIKYLVMKNFAESQSLDMRLSFENSGLNMNLVWTCEGTLGDFVAMMVINEVYQRDEISLRQIFRDQNDPNFAKDPDILEVSEIFPVEYALGNDGDKTKERMDFRVTILRTDRPTNYRLRRVSPFYHSLVINLCLQDMIAPTGTGIAAQPITLESESQPISEPCKRLDRLSHDIINRICESRNSQLRRYIGENNYIIATSIGGQ